jgi:hypothetical protein
MAVCIPDSDPDRPVVALATTSDDERMLGSELQDFNFHP